MGFHLNFDSEKAYLSAARRDKIESQMKELASAARISISILGSSLFESRRRIDLLPIRGEREHGQILGYCHEFGTGGIRLEEFSSHRSIE